MVTKYELEKLASYYRNKDLAIIGLNDSQGVKGLLKNIDNALKDENLRPLIINAYSLTMNKTEHIDYFLENNLSLEEIKLSQIYSTVSAFEKVMKDIHLPKALGKIGYLSKLFYQPKPGDEKLFITDTLRTVKEPILIYSSGVNNLMREVGNNPMSIKKDYEQRHNKPNFLYTKTKALDPNTLNIVMNGIETNFENILSINGNTDVYALGSYVPKALSVQEMNVFRNLVLRYNELLQNLCDRYKIAYVDTEFLGEEFSKSSIDFHVSSTGYGVLASYILEKMYERKIWKQEKCNVDKEFICNNDGPEGVIKKTSNNYQMRYEKSNLESDEYSLKRELAICQEHSREIEVFKKVKKASITKRY